MKIQRKYTAKALLTTAAIGVLLSSLVVTPAVYADDDGLDPLRKQIADMKAQTEAIREQQEKSHKRWRVVRAVAGTGCEIVGCFIVVPIIVPYLGARIAFSAGDALLKDNN